jgi:hypothetical protein
MQNVHFDKLNPPPELVFGEAGQDARDAYRDAYHLFTICGLETRWCIRDDFRVQLELCTTMFELFSLLKVQLGLRTMMFELFFPLKVQLGLRTMMFELFSPFKV